MCNIHQLSKKAYHFDGFTFYNSWEEPNDWHMHSHKEIQITLPQANTKALINSESLINKTYAQEIKAGEAFLISPNQRHTLDWQHKAELTLFYLHPHFFADTINESIDHKNLSLNNSCKLIDDLIVRQIGSMFRNLCVLGLESEILYMENIASLLAIHLLKNHLNYNFIEPHNYSGLSHNKFNLIVEYIEANLSQKITLSDLAGVVNLGKFYFSHSFKRQTNMTPYDFVLQLRVKRAKKLLQSSNIPICDIALECGFGNQSHLTKHFRKKLGVTPMNYRKSVQ